MCRDKLSAVNCPETASRRLKLPFSILEPYCWFLRRRSEINPSLLALHGSRSFVRPLWLDPP